MVPSISIANIRKFQPVDLPRIVDIHICSFDGFFLTFLGRNFLYELYSGIINAPTGIGFVHADGEMLLGFVVGTSQPAGFYRRLLIKRWWRFGLASINPLVHHPSILPRLLRAFSKPSEYSDGNSYCEIMSLAVLPEFQGRGIGQSLVKAFIQEASRRETKTIKLTTDRLKNDAVNGFYQRLGFTCTHTFTTPEGRVMNEYKLDI